MSATTIGLIALLPLLLMAIGFIIKNIATAINNQSSCTQDCNQGRECTCQK